MRTTLVLNDEVFVEAKRIAAERQTNLSALVNEALRQVIDGQHEGAPLPSYQIPTYRGGRKIMDTPPGELATLAEDDELTRFAG